MKECEVPYRVLWQLLFVRNRAVVKSNTPILGSHGLANIERMAKYAHITRHFMIAKMLLHKPGTTATSSGALNALFSIAAL
jgi:hypothetical protein